MDKFPHLYTVSAEASSEDALTVTAEDLPMIVAAPPKEFDGPGDCWSPETLLMSSVASCFALSFRAVAAASKFDWIDLSCVSEGTLDRVDKVTRFTQIVNRVALTVPADTDIEKAEKLLHKAESVCLISNSLRAEVALEIEIRSAAS